MNEFRYITDINLNEKNELPGSIEIMRKGKWKHPIHGDLEINDNTMNDIIKNFETNTRGIDVSFDLEHGTTNHKSEAVAWVKGLKKQEDKLYANVNWTKLGEEKIKNKSFKYFSPEYQKNYTDNATGKQYTNVLLGGALTNRPFIKNMGAIVLSETIDLSIDNVFIKQKEKEDIMNPEILKTLKLSEKATEKEIAEVINKIVFDSVKLSEDNEILKKDKETLNTEIDTLKKDKESLTTKLSELNNDKSTADQKIIQLNEDIKTINQRLKEADWKQVESIALSEGKLTPAMTETFKSQYMNDPEATKKIIDCLQPVINLSENGSSQGVKDTSNIKLFETKVNEIMTRDKSTYADALIKAEKENKELFRLFEQERGAN